MELQGETRRNIIRTTGLLMSDLLKKEPIKKPQLKNLQRRQASRNADVLIRGNPQLTSGYITEIEDVDEYFSLKWERKEMKE